MQDYDRRYPTCPIPLPDAPRIMAVYTLWNHQSLKQCGNFVDLLECIFADNRDPTLFSMVAWNLWNRRNNLSLAKGMVSLGQLL